MSAKIDDILQGLTAKQAAFVRWYTTPGDTMYNGTESCRRAQYSGSDATLAQQAWENLRKPKIARAARRIINEMYKANDITAERVLADIEMTRLLALQAGRFTDALKASELHGKYLKMFADKLEVVHSIEDVDDQVLLDMFNELKGKTNVFDTGTARRTTAKAGHAGDTPGTAKTH